MIGSQRATSVDPAATPNPATANFTQQDLHSETYVHSMRERPVIEYPPPHATMSLPSAEHLPLEHLQLEPRAVDNFPRMTQSTLDAVPGRTALVPFNVQPLSCEATRSIQDVGQNVGQGRFIMPGECILRNRKY